jgi:hypothetical protein
MKTIQTDQWQLLDGQNNLVEVDRIVDYPGFIPDKQFKLSGGTPPHKPSSTGRVYGAWVSNPDFSREYFPQVFDLRWVKL